MPTATCRTCQAPVSRPGRKCRTHGLKGRKLSAEHRQHTHDWWTPERRAAHRLKMQIIYRTINRTAVGGGARWTPPEEAMLNRLAGTMTAREIAVEISKLGAERTVAAVRKRADEHGISIMVGGHNQACVRRIFDVSTKTVVEWTRGGLLIGRRNGTSRIAHWIFSDADVLRFIREHPLAYEWSKIKHAHFRSEAEIVAKRREWIPTTVAAEHLRMPYKIFHRHVIKAGLLETRTGPHPTRRWQVFVRRGDLHALAT